MNAPTRSAGPLLGSGRVTAAEAGACAVERRLAESRAAGLADGRAPGDGQRPASRARRGRRPRHPAGMAARQRAHRQQGGLRRGRVRRLRGAGGPRRTATGRTRWTAINACLVPAAGFDDQEVSPPRASASPAALHPVQQRDGRPRRLPVRLLHTGFHLLDGRGVLPAGAGTGRTGAAEAEPERPGSRRARPTASARAGHAPTTSTGRTASTCTR